MRAESVPTRVTRIELDTAVTQKSRRFFNQLSGMPDSLEQSKPAGQNTVQYCASSVPVLDASVTEMPDRNP